MSSSLHAERFRRTKRPRENWDLAKMSTKSVSISTEVPIDVIKAMERIGPIMEARGIITKNTSYSILQYCVILKIISLDMAINELTEPNQNLTKYLTKKRHIKPTLTRKTPEEMYTNKNTIPISSTVPKEIAMLAEKYGGILEEKQLIPMNTPYNMWKYCATSVMNELEKQLSN